MEGFEIKNCNMSFIKKILRPFLLHKKLIKCTFPSPMERVRERCVRVRCVRVRWFVLGLGIFLISCDDMEDKLKPDSNTGLGEPTHLYILSEGLFNMNNSTLASYDLNSKTLISDFFLSVNKRGLGDTANDMGIYGSKMYVVVNVSSQIEVLDVNTGKSLAKIAIKNE